MLEVIGGIECVVGECCECVVLCVKLVGYCFEFFGVVVG